MDKVREGFEDWAMSCDMCTYFDDAEYRHQSTEWAWKAWKASRAALCVELPDNLDGEYYADGWNACLIAVGEKIEESGVSYK